MKLTLYNIGKTDISYIREGMSEYEKRIRHFTDFSVVDLPVKKVSKNESPEQLCKREGEQALKAMENAQLIVLLDERGKELSSRGFAQWLEKVMDQGLRQVAFLTGGAYGFSDEVSGRSHVKLSLSKMTFTHQMVRLIFTEQLYRAFTLIKGLPYHND